MREAAFWEIISRCFDPDTDEHRRRLVEALKQLPIGEILEFQHVWNQQRNALYLAENFESAAAFALDTGSDSSIFGFVRWLILQGQSVVEHAVSDPDSIAVLFERIGQDDLYCAAYPTTDALRELTGETFDQVSDRYERRYGPGSWSIPVPSAEVWDPWENEELVRSRLPRLWRLSRSD